MIYPRKMVPTKSSKLSETEKIQNINSYNFKVIDDKDLIFYSNLTQSR